MLNLKASNLAQYFVFVVLRQGHVAPANLKLGIILLLLAHNLVFLSITTVYRQGRTEIISFFPTSVLVVGVGLEDVGGELKTGPLTL